MPGEIGRDEEYIEDSEMEGSYNIVEVTSLKRKKKCRRSQVKKNKKKSINIMYANIQGVRGKVTSLKYVLSTLSADIILLTETMVQNVKLDGYQCINPKKSVGQNVSIVLSEKLAGCPKMKLYEPNDSINMIGVRLEINGCGTRIYTAHMKQQSSNSRDDIKAQFDEIKNQFRSANHGREPMLLICDANVHVGNVTIKGCKDSQDWGGKEFMSVIQDENLILINALDICSGVVTRVDPRNGNQSTIDLAICNSLMMELVNGMKIDEDGDYKLKNYGKRVTETDHNTILVKLSIQHTKKA